MAFARAQALRAPSQSVTANTTLDGTKGVVFADATAGNITLTLPPAAQDAAMMILVRRTDASVNLVTVAAAAGDTVDGAASVLITTMVPGKIFSPSSATAWRTVVGT